MYILQLFKTPFKFCMLSLYIHALCPCGLCLRSLFVFQAGGLLTQVTTLLNTFKNSSVGRYLSYAQMKTQHIKKSKSKTEQNQVTTSDLETGSSNQVSTYTWVVTAWIIKLQEFWDMIGTLRLHYTMIITLLKCGRSLVTRFKCQNCIVVTGNLLHFQ